jgi:hypothetical protein
MKLQKLHSLRVGNQRVIQRYFEKIDEANSTSTQMHFNVIFEALERKVIFLIFVAEKVLNQTDVDIIAYVIITTENNTLKLNVKLRD